MILRRDLGSLLMGGLLFLERLLLLIARCLIDSRVRLGRDRREGCKSVALGLKGLLKGYALR